MANGRKKGNSAVPYETELAGTASAPFDTGEHSQIPIKVMDECGNEMMVVKSLPEAGKS